MFFCHVVAGAELQICKWNLMKFAEALNPALPLEEADAALDKYDELYKGYYEEGMRRYGSTEAIFVQSQR